MGALKNHLTFLNSQILKIFILGLIFEWMKFKMILIGKPNFCPSNSNHQTLIGVRRILICFLVTDSNYKHNFTFQEKKNLFFLSEVFVMT